MTSDPSQPVQWGDFLDPIPPSEEYLTLHFSLDRISRLNRWRNYGLSADFLGDYFATFFPGEAQDSGISQQEAVKGSVSYIANELLENAVKYGAAVTGHPISITLYLYDQLLIFTTRNVTSPSNAEKYQTFIQRLLVSDPQELYIEQLEKSAMGSNDESHIGVLTMINDYQARFGWQFNPLAAPDKLVDVVVMTHLDIAL